MLVSLAQFHLSTNKPQEILVPGLYNEFSKIFATLFSLIQQIPAGSYLDYIKVIGTLFLNSWGNTIVKNRIKVIA